MNLVLYSFGNVHTKVSDDSIEGNCFLWLIRLFKYLFQLLIRLLE